MKLNCWLTCKVFYRSWIIKLVLIKFVYVGDERNCIINPIHTQSLRRAINGLGISICISVWSSFQSTCRCIDERILYFSTSKIYHPFQPLCTFKTNIPYQEMCFNIYLSMQNCNIYSELSNEHGNNSWSLWNWKQLFRILPTQHWLTTHHYVRHNNIWTHDYNAILMKRCFKKMGCLCSCHRD